MEYIHDFSLINYRPSSCAFCQRLSRIDSTSDEQAIGPKSAIFNHTTNGKNENAKKNELPQTGSAHEGPLAWLGSLFAGLSLFGLAADRKRKKKDDN